MVVFFDTCPPNLLEWIEKQHLFFVATAPLQADGHVNVSPKGAYDCFHVESPTRVWYEDLTGSGNETISHLRENGRITVMFIAFDGPPRIVRLFGTGKAYEFGTPEYHDYIPDHIRKPGSRSVIVVDVHKVGSSCGYTIPYYDFRGNRSMLLENMVRREQADLLFEQEHPGADPHQPDGTGRAEKGMRAYWVNTNLTSVDGLEGVREAPFARKVPQSAWSLEAFKREEAARKWDGAGKSANGTAGEVREADVKTATEHQLVRTTIDAKLLVGFSLGVLTTAMLMKLGS